MKRKSIQTVLALLIVSFLLIGPRAQQTPPAAQPQEDRVALYQALLDLTNPWTVMCIAAHPDDEDGTSLIVMRRKYGAHTVSLFSTFGEGGQNAIGPELYEEMGAIRARETMAAAEIQGSEPHFLGLKDFGFSKSADEAFRIWGHDEALRRMVLQIRKLRPDVIITNHNSTSGHGHHQATGRLELEAFDAAADPKRFPEQLKGGVTTWQVQRFFLRVGFGNRLPEQNGGTVTIDPNERDPIRGAVFAEEALRALQKHATQGPWPKTFADMLRFRNSQDGKLPLTRYVLVREAKGAAALPGDSHSVLAGFQTPTDVANQPPTIDGRPLTEFIDQRDRVFQALVVVYNRLYTGEEARVKTGFLYKRLFQALAVASGVAVKITPEDKVIMPGKTSSFLITISNHGPLTVRPYLRDFNGVSEPNANSSSTLLTGKSITMTRKYETPSNAKVSVPHAQHLYDGLLFGERISATAVVAIQGADFLVPAETSIDVVPPIEIETITPSPVVLTPATVNRPINFMLRLVNHQNTAFTGILSAQSERLKVGLPARAAREFQFRLRHGLPGEASDLRFAVTSSNAVSVPIHVGFSDARVAPSLNVGYIRGFDYSLPNALNALGVESKELSVDEVKTADLQKYSTIIVDNRVYESQPELIAVNQKLLDYANAGGTLIVFYHKSNEWNPDPRRNRPQQLAPYKLVLGDARITDETAPITFLEPEHPLLNFPNKMGQEDFANWIQERGLYYPREWDPQYHALLQSNDPGEAPLKGGLLVADYGRGRYIYTSMVWYRELRGGVPGAYRMLANMISYGAAEGKSKK